MVHSHPDEMLAHRFERRQGFAIEGLKHRGNRNARRLGGVGARLGQGLQGRDCPSLLELPGGHGSRNERDRGFAVG
jgi:hypothetical protein